MSCRFIENNYSMSRFVYSEASAQFLKVEYDMGPNMRRVARDLRGSSPTLVISTN